MHGFTFKQAVYRNSIEAPQADKLFRTDTALASLNGNQCRTRHSYDCRSFLLRSSCGRTRLAKAFTEFGRVYFVKTVHFSSYQP